MDLHDGKLHQVPDRHLGIPVRPRVHLLLLLPPRIPLPVHPLHAAIQDPAGVRVRVCVFVCVCVCVYRTVMIIQNSKSIFRSTQYVLPTI